MNMPNDKERSKGVVRGRQAGWLALAAAGVLLLAGPSAGAPGQTAGAPNGNAQNGRALYSSKNCAQCHGMSGEGTAAAPSLLINPIAYANFLSQLRRPIDTMPVVRESDVSDAQVADLYAFVRSLTPAAASATGGGAAAGNAENGKRIYTAYGCYACHGYMAQGAGTGPRLGPRPIALANMIKELRHPSEMPPYTEKVISDAEIADIHAFLQSLPEPPKLDSIPLLSK
jgi:mono/diheme cytochrome c family protein